MGPGAGSRHETCSRPQSMDDDILLLASGAHLAETHRPRLPCIQPTLISLTLLLAILSAGPVGTGIAADAEPEQIVVRLASGRTFAAAVDDRTDSEHLWLRFQRGGANILRPVTWQSIESVWRGQRALTAAELRQVVDELRSSGPQPRRARQADAQSPATEENADNPAFAGGASAAPLATNANAPDDVVRSIAIDASVARWSSGVESDGVLLRVAPLDAEGQVIPASGALEVDLFGDQYGSPVRGQDYRLLGHWVSRVDAAQVTPEGAVFRLPFQAVSADFAVDLGSYAMVHARFTAPGHGTFEASTNPLRLRAYNGVRDRIQQAEGTRFFRNERTNRSQGRYVDPR